MISSHRFLWGCMAVFVLSGCSAMPLRFPGGAPVQTLEEEYRLHPNDEIEISVWGQSDLNRSASIREDGTISFPFIGDVVVHGRTLREVEQMLSQSLSEGYIRNPHVSAKLVNQRFSMLGEIERPGTYPLDGRVDLLAALSVAGGLNKFASTRVEVIRTLWDGQKVSYEVDVKAILSGRRPTILIHPYDTSHVKRKMF